jgi:rsbT antagonist protein RsbS
MDGHDAASIPLQVSRGCVVASIQVDLSDAVLAGFRTQLLELLHSSGAAGVILDMSGVEVLDLEEFDALQQTMDMAQLMGARTVFSGFRPGVVSALLDLDADTRGMYAALNLDAAFDMLEEFSAPEPAEEPVSEEDEPQTGDHAGTIGPEFRDDQDPRSL